MFLILISLCTAKAQDAMRLGITRSECAKIIASKFEQNPYNAYQKPYIRNFGSQTFDLEQNKCLFEDDKLYSYSYISDMDSQLMTKFLNEIITEYKSYGYAVMQNNIENYAFTLNSVIINIIILKNSNDEFVQISKKKEAIEITHTIRNIIVSTNVVDNRQSKNNILRMTNIANYEYYIKKGNNNMIAATILSGASIIAGCIAINSIPKFTKNRNEWDDYNAAMGVCVIAGITSTICYICAIVNYSNASRYKFSPYYSKSNANSNFNDIQGISFKIKI